MIVNPFSRHAVQHSRVTIYYFDLYYRHVELCNLCRAVLVKIT